MNVAAMVVVAFAKGRPGFDPCRLKMMCKLHFFVHSLTTTFAAAIELIPKDKYSTQLLLCPKFPFLRKTKAVRQLSASTKGQRECGRGKCGNGNISGGIHETKDFSGEPRSGIIGRDVWVEIDVHRRPEDGRLAAERPSSP